MKIAIPWKHPVSGWFRFSLNWWINDLNPFIIKWLISKSNDKGPIVHIFHAKFISSARLKNKEVFIQRSALIKLNNILEQGMKWGIFTTFCVKKRYFHCTREKIMDFVPQSIIFCGVKISFLHTKGCGNAIPISLMIKLII